MAAYNNLIIYITIGALFAKICPRKSVLTNLSSQICPHKSVLTNLSSQICPHKSVLTNLSSQICPHKSVLTNLSSQICPHKSVLTNLSSQICPHKSVLTNLSSKFDEFLAERSQFYTDHRVNWYAHTCCQSATFGPLLHYIVLCFLREKIINNAAIRHRCDFYAAIFR